MSDPSPFKDTLYKLTYHANKQAPGLTVFVQGTLLTQYSSMFLSPMSVGRELQNVEIKWYPSPTSYMLKGVVTFVEVSDTYELVTDLTCGAHAGKFTEITSLESFFMGIVVAEETTELRREAHHPFTPVNGQPTIEVLKQISISPVADLNRWYGIGYKKGRPFLWSTVKDTRVNHVNKTMAFQLSCISVLEAYGYEVETFDYVHGDDGDFCLVLELYY